MTLVFINMHEIHTCYIFNWKFSRLSYEIKQNFLSFVRFDSETKYYNMVVKSFDFANFASEYQPFHFISSYL